MNHFKCLGLCFAVLKSDPPVSCFLFYFRLYFPLYDIVINSTMVFNSETVTCIGFNDSIFTTHPMLEPRALTPLNFLVPYNMMHFNSTGFFKPHTFTVNNYACRHLLFPLLFIYSCISGFHLGSFCLYLKNTL